jgi:DNA mismatch repair protein MSH6
MSIKEVEPRTFGVCFADAATGEFNVCSFEDDPAYSQLETLLVQVAPKELVLEKGGVSRSLQRLLRIYAGGVEQNRLEVGAERGGFWDAEQTKDALLRHQGLWKDPTDADVAGVEHWPPVMQAAVANDTVICAVGGLVSYLKKLLLVNTEDGGNSILTHAQFTEYDPMTHGNSLMLDGQTLQNLDILQNSTDGGERGSLFALLCHTNTAFGKRRFRKWLCHPLRDVPAIQDRHAAIESR